jgi:polar amino acid transport system substrate-binding protein
MFRQFLFLVLFAACAFSAMAAGLKVGVSPDYPPMVFKHEGRIVGVEADNVTALGNILGQSLTLVEMPFGQLIPALQSGQIDIIMSGMSVTPERSEAVLFTDGYLKVGQMAIMSTDKVGEFSQPWSIYREGVRIGVEPDTTGAAFAASELKDAQVKFYSDPPAAFTGLRNNEIDLYIHDAPTSWQLAKTPENSDLISLYAPLTDEQLAWAVRKDDQRLADMLNDALKTMKGNGTLGYIINRWIPVTVEVH